MFDDLKFKIQKGDTLVRLILINFLVFIPLLLINVVSKLTKYDAFIDQIISFFALPSLFSLLIIKPWTLVLHGFTHIDVLHFLYNMLGLYWLGGIIQEFIGEKRLVNIYILGVIAGGTVFVLAYNLFPYFENQYGTLIGASGAVFALGVGAITLLPNYTVYFPIFGEVKLKYIVGIYLLLSLAGTVGMNPGGSFAHLGGGFLGFVYIIFLNQGYDLGSPIQKSWTKVSGIFRKKAKMKVTYKKLEFVGSEYPDQDEIDRILDKMNQKGGYNALSKEEKEKLFKYSQK